MVMEQAAEIDQRLGRAEGYLGRVLRGEVRLSVEMLFSILEVLGSDPADFFARVAGARQVDPEPLLLRIERQGSPATDLLLERVEALLGETFEGLENDTAELKEWLTEIDDLRLVDPKQAAKQARECLYDVLALCESAPTLPHAKILCNALGVSASIERVRAHYPPAALRLRLALRLARRYNFRPSYAKLLQRTCYLVGDQTDYETALELAKQANDLYVVLCDKKRIGQTLVDRAIMLYPQGKYEDAIEAYSSSLEFLPKESWQNRTAALQGIAASQLILGDLQSAWSFADQAIQAQKVRTGQSWWRLIWLQGEIALKRNLLVEAESAFSQVHDAFMTP